MTSLSLFHDFETIGSRESEGQLTTQRTQSSLDHTPGERPGVSGRNHSRPPSFEAFVEGYFLLDRHRGLTLKVPNGRGQMVAGHTFTLFSARAQRRENFESMRLLYVAATRAKDRLILSGATRDLGRLAKGDDSWLQSVWQALELGAQWQSRLIELEEDTQLQLTLNLIDRESEVATPGAGEIPADSVDLNQDLSQVFPLLRPVAPERDSAVHRFSVTQLINYQRCPRQYYFDRVLHVPTADQMAIWNDAEAPEPPANLTATLKGAVIHRFCEMYSTGDDPEKLLRQSFAHVLRKRQAELADRLVRSTRKPR